VSAAAAELFARMTTGTQPSPADLP
jgi:hypothetical protein